MLRYVAFFILLVVVLASVISEAAPQNQVQFSIAVEEQADYRKYKILTATAFAKTQTAIAKATFTATPRGTSTVTPGLRLSPTVTPTASPTLGKR